MIEIINLEKLDNDGRKQPANDPTSSTPDNITHCQLRYNTFTSSYVIQGVAVTGASSTFQFTIPSTTGAGITNFPSLFKLYVSTDGTTYTEKQSYGGTLGKSINLNPVTERFLYLLFKQTGTSVPTVTIANNFNEATVDYATLDATGIFTVYFSVTFMQESTISMAPQPLFQNVSSVTPIGFIHVMQTSTDYITFATLNLSNVPANNLVNPDSLGDTGVYLPIKIINLINA